MEDPDAGRSVTAATAQLSTLAHPGIEVIVSDLDGVLRHFDEGLWGRIAGTTGLASDSLRDAILGDPFLSEVTAGRARHASWRRHASARLVGLGLNGPEAARAVAMWAGCPGTVDPRMRACLLDARRRGLAVFLLTNGTDRVPSELADLDLEELTGPRGAVVLNSWDLRAAKPTAEAFGRAHRIIEGTLGRRIPREAVLFLDDTAGHVRAARDHGWHSVHVTG